MISVILPVLNGEKTILAAVNSILNQTYSDLELLILDGGSSDGTIGLLGKIEDERLRFWVREDLKGKLGSALNFLIKESKGNYIARMDADDVSLLNRFEVQLSYFEKFPELCMIGAQFHSCHSGQIFKSTRRLPTSHQGILKELLNGYFSLAHPTVMFRKDVLKTDKVYVVEGIAEDLQFYLDMSKLGMLANTEEVLFLYSVSVGSLSGSKQWYVDSFYRYTIFKFLHEREFLTYDDFMKSYRMFPLYQRIRLKVTHIGNNLYKYSIKYSSNKLLSLILLLVASIFKPFRAAKRFKQILGLSSLY